VAIPLGTRILNELQMKNLFGTLRSDVPASLVVFLVAVPLCLGIAVASGAPPFAGLLAGIIGGLIVAPLSGSRLGVSGPAAGLTAIVVTSMAALGSFQLFLLAVLLAGVFQLLLGVARGGIIAHFFPSAVVQGMLAGIGLFIALAQVPHMLGTVAGAGTGGLFAGMAAAFADPHAGTLTVAFASLAVLLAWGLPAVQRVAAFKRIPAPLVAVLVGAGLAQLLPLFGLPALGSAHFVRLPDLGAAGWSSLFQGPDLNGLMNPLVWTTAITLALVASLETLLSVEATDKQDPERGRTPRNRELVAQGVGNIVAGLLGGLPVTQVIVRSSTNLQAGARTKVSAVLHSLWIAAVLALAPGLLGTIPLAALAAILVQVGYKLARPALFSTMWRGGWERFAPFLATVLGVVLLDLLKGVGLGVAVALLTILRNNYRTPFHLLERPLVPGTPVRIALGEASSFLHKASIQRTMDELPPGTHIVVDVSRTVALDPDVRDLLHEGAERAAAKGSRVEVTGLREQRRHRTAVWLSMKHVRETYRFVSTERQAAQA
jgi:SulP family sulfate permease